MNDLISRQAAIDALNIPDYENGEAYLQYESDVNAIRSLPAQPERMRGRWIYGSPVTMKCDQCGYYIADWRQKESNFCPNCGADMRGEQDGSI